MLALLASLLALFCGLAADSCRSILQSQRLASDQQNLMTHSDTSLCVLEMDRR